MTDEAVWEGVLDDADARIKLDRLRALHVNDATDPLGSNRDRHANMGEGLIGKGMSVSSAARASKDSRPYRDSRAQTARPRQGGARQAPQAPQAGRHRVRCGALNRPGIGAEPRGLPR